MSYERERDEFIARMTAEGLSLPAILTLLRTATAMQRYAELSCSSEAADRDRIDCPASPVRLTGYKGWIGNPRTPTGACLCDRPNDGHETIPRITLQDHRAEQRAAAALPDGWQLDSQGDPRGYVLRVIPPSYAERNAGRDRFNRDTIGVPARPSRLRF